MVISFNFISLWSFFFSLRYCLHVDGSHVKLLCTILILNELSEHIKVK